MEAGRPGSLLSCPSCSFRMGCTAGHTACQPQSPVACEVSAFDNHTAGPQEAGAKAPDVLSSLERLSQATGGMEKSWYRCTPSASRPLVGFYINRGMRRCVLIQWPWPFYLTDAIILILPCYTKDAHLIISLSRDDP